MSVKGTVVIVTYNAVGIIGDCLDSLLDDHASGLVKVVVVDNVSTDGTVDFIADRYSWVTIVRSEDNGGFGAGNNLGVQHLEGQFCFFLNPDCVVLPGCIGELIKYLEQNPDVGCVGPAVFDEARTPVVSHYMFTNLILSLWTAIGLQRIIPLNRTNGHWEIRRKPSNKTVEVDRLIGASMMVKGDILEKLGGFDERFFLYSEEEDLCIRIKQAGLKIIYHPAGSVIHTGAGTTGHNNPLAIASTNWSRYLYMRKHCSRFSAELSRWVWIAALLIRLFASRIVGSSQRIECYQLSLKSLINLNFFDRELRPKRAANIILPS